VISTEADWLGEALVFLTNRRRRRTYRATVKGSGGGR
jgi:hypothetical protein